MSVRESEIFFAATVKAFKEKVHEIVRDVHLAATDGVGLWLLLDRHYLPIERSSLEVCSQRKEYDSIAMQSTETYEQYMV